MVDDSGSDINGYLVASMAGPVKRKRGRPRKNPVPVGETAAKAELMRVRGSQPFGTVRIDEGELAFDYRSHRPGPAAYAAAGHEGVEGHAEGPALKRRRGRPRKDPRTEAGVIAGPTGLQALEPCVGTGVIGRADVPVKRKSGRPRKDNLPGARSPVVSITGLPSGMAGGRMMTEPAVILVKRGPGRPRKVPLIAALAPVAPGDGPFSGLTGTGTGPGLVVGPVKRKMGRPRKNPLAAAGVPVAPIAGLASDLAATGTVAEQVGERGPQLAVGPGPVLDAGLAPVQVVAPPKRKPGRPRKHPLPEPDKPVNKEGIGFWPPHPDEAKPVRPAATGIGFVTALKRGRRLKTELSPIKAPARRRKRSLGPAVGGGRAFCGKCGTYIRMFRPARGRWRKVCPRCHPEKMLETKRPGVNLDKSGMPCKDRGTCRPERCVMAFDCEEMKKHR